MPIGTAHRILAASFDRYRNEIVIATRMRDTSTAGPVDFRATFEDVANSAPNPSFSLTLLSLPISRRFLTDWETRFHFEVRFVCFSRLCRSSGIFEEQIERLLGCQVRGNDSREWKGFDEIF